VPPVLGQVDGRHPAGTELALDAVSVGDGRGEPISLLRGTDGHGAAGERETDVANM